MTAIDLDGIEKEFAAIKDCTCHGSNPDAHYRKHSDKIPDLIRMVRQRDAEIAKMNRALLYIRDGVACVSPGCKCGQSPRQIADAALKGGKNE